jgi:hypothetical protein
LPDEAREVGDADLLVGAHVVEVLVFRPSSTTRSRAVGEVADVAERAGLLAGPLDLERDAAPSPGLVAEGARHAHDELGHDVLEAHVGAVDVVGPEDDGAVEVFAGRS